MSEFAELIELIKSNGVSLKYDPETYISHMLGKDFTEDERGRPFGTCEAEYAHSRKITSKKQALLGEKFASFIAENKISVPPELTFSLYYRYYLFAFVICKMDGDLKCGTPTTPSFLKLYEKIVSIIIPRASTNILRSMK